MTQPLPDCCYAAAGASAAEQMYAAYNAAGDRKGLNFQGQPCPPWKDLPEDVKKKWEAVANESKWALIDSIVHILGTWWKTRDKEGHTLTPDSFEIEADHSLRGGLLGWILDGRKPQPVPPPLFLSRPWHTLIESGEATVSGFLVWKFKKMPARRDSDVVVIGQSPEWHIVEERDNGVMLLRNKRPEHGQWLATPSYQNGSEPAFWHLKRIS